MTVNPYFQAAEGGREERVTVTLDCVDSQTNLLYGFTTRGQNASKI